MIPHNFRRQRADRHVSARLVNQTLDDVRRLAISWPGPGLGGLGTPGGLLQFVNSTGFLLAQAPGAIPARNSATDPVLPSGDANPVGIGTTEDGTASLSTDSGTTLRVYNLSTQEVPAGYVICLKLWNLWVVIWADCPASGG